MILQAKRQLYELYSCKTSERLFLLVLAVCVWLSACSPEAADRSLRVSKEKGLEMETHSSTTAVKYKMPPIDVKAVTNTLTATFAMG